MLVCLLHWSWVGTQVCEDEVCCNSILPQLSTILYNSLMVKYDSLLVKLKLEERSYSLWLVVN